MSDLFGCDLPSEDGSGFSWRDGPLLKALKQGNWILLDEMNLASQAVLEGEKLGYIFIRITDFGLLLDLSPSR